MGEAALDTHHHRLVLLVADHDTLQRALRHSLTLYSFDFAAVFLAPVLRLLADCGFLVFGFSDFAFSAFGLAALGLASACGAALTAGSGAPRRFCPAMVLSRAMSRRITRTREVFSSWPVARWKRRLNCSFLSLITSSSIWSRVIALTSAAFMDVYSAMRSMKRVLTGSLAAASASASLATATGTPSISNKMRPGLTRVTHNSGVPLPLPMRTSIGFFDTGTSGNTRIHTRPDRFIKRVRARRAASIWRAVTRSGS